MKAFHTVRPATFVKTLSKTISGGAIAASLAIAATLPALAEPSAVEPIEIRSCSPIYAPVGEQVYAMGMQTLAGVEIDFINHADIAASEVTFQVGSDAGTTLSDRGTFAPQTLVRQVFWTARTADVRDCRVAAVRFQNGIEAATSPAGATTHR